jgi:flagellar biosynthesis/type III secretory pathway chaperone
MNSDTHRRLEVVLDREIEAARSLATTLAAERAALTGSSPDAVVQEAAHKTAIFGVITTLEAERRELCDANSISLPNMQRGRTPVMPGISESIADRWRALLELIAGCRVANEVNGYIINARRSQLNQLFQALRGGAPVTYDPHGKLFNKSQRALARA